MIQIRADLSEHSPLKEYLQLVAHLGVRLVQALYNLCAPVLCVCTTQVFFSTKVPMTGGDPR